MVIKNRMMRIKEVRLKVGISRSMIYALMARGEFPASVKYSERIVVWSEDELDAWIMGRRKKAEYCPKAEAKMTSKATYTRTLSEAA